MKINPNDFKNFSGKLFKGVSATGVILFGLGYLALNSYYYGKKPMT